MKKLWLIVLLITFFGAGLRIWGFPTIPSELNRDEAALGYNAFSLLKTGHDEWGVTWPVVFKSFGDFKLPGYIYLLIPFVQFFGLTPVAVRLPSLLAGILLVPLAIAFIFQLSKNRGFALLAGLAISVSPWAIHYSRVGFEANVALTLMVACFTLLLTKKSFGKSQWFGLILLFLSLMTYNSPLLLLYPFLGLLLLLKRISWKTAVAAGILGVIVFISVLPATKGKTAITLFSDQTLEFSRRDKRQQAQTIGERIATNPYVFYPVEVGKRYLESFSPRFLVTIGGHNPWHQAPDLSHLGWVLYASMLVGFMFMVHDSIQKKPFALLFMGMLLISPMPSMITVDAPHATRSLFMLFLMSCLAGYAVSIFLRQKTILKYVGMMALSVVLVSGLFYVRESKDRFLNRPQAEWQIGMQSIILEANQASEKEDLPIYVVGNMHFDYIYALFYGTFDPALLGEKHTTSFGRYTFVVQEKEVKVPALVILRKRDELGKEIYVLEKRL
jgi:4-amino-4-deoxy-L-arabinose transferase-like glycosyltransferase